MDIRVDEMIFEHFEKQDKTKFSSYPHYVYYQQKKEEFMGKLPANLHCHFNEMLSSKKTFEDEYFKEFIRFVLQFVKEIF